MGNIFGVITARGGSKRLPGKNIKTLAGKPMIAWTIDAANESNVLSNVYVSTEDDEIAHVARQWGAEVVIRPKVLAKDTTLSIDVIVNVINELGLDNNDYIMLLQPTSPLRTRGDIRKCVAHLKTTKSDNIVSATVGTEKPNGAIYLNKVSSLLSTRTFYPEGRTVWYVMPAERSVDIDTDQDFQLAEYLLKEQRK
jgi:CMP-N,N'-diacetyllegionaminic acid synthase